MNTQLLCTFCTEDTLQVTLSNIKEMYNIAFGSIYVLENRDCSASLCCTYNILLDEDGSGGNIILDSTISLHRKKMTNTLYTINALNLLVAELNEGKQDSSFKVPWESFRNMILVTAYGSLKKIPTKLRTIVKIDDI